MSQGLANSATLYDASGNPITVTVVNGVRQLAVADASAALFNRTTQTELLAAILLEMRVTNYYLQVGLNVKDDPDSIRAALQSAPSTAN